MSTTLMISPLLPIEHHPLYKNPKFADFFKTTTLVYFCMVKRDNNCFYTAISYIFLKKAQNMSHERLTKLLSKLATYKEDFIKQNGSSVAFDDTFMQFEENLKNQNLCNINVDDSGAYQQVLDYNTRLEMYATEVDQYLYNYMIAFFKMIISTHLKVNKDLYTDIIGDVNDYCKNNVDVFNKDVGDVEISVISIVFEVSIRMHYVEGNNVFSVGEWDDCVDIMYTPGHFEPAFMDL